MRFEVGDGALAWGLSAVDGGRRRGGGVTAARGMEPLEEKALRGDDAAWNQLIARYDRRVWSTLLAMGADPDVTADVVQEAWVKLVQRSRAGELQELRLPGLAVAQARYLWLHRLEGRKATVSPDDPDAGVVLVDPGVDAERGAADRQSLQQVLTALEACPPRTRDIVRSVFDEGMTAAEASARFGISVQRIRQTLCEVRATLRAALGAGR